MPRFMSTPTETGWTHTAWNEIGTHPLQQLSRSSETLCNVVEAYCEHRLQHLLTVRPPGKGPETPFTLPYCVSYLRYMAGRCTFCYKRVQSEAYGAVDFTIPVCSLCKYKFPRSRIIRWERAEQKYELPLEELKTNCAWSPMRETIPVDEFEDDSGSDFGSDEGFYRSAITGTMMQSRKTYVFDDRDIQRHIKRRYGDLDTFFATLEKKRWDKKLELERMEKQRCWAREEIERRITANEAMVEGFIAEHEEMEKERVAEKQKMCDELMARTERQEGIFLEWLDTFLDGTAGPEGRCDETGEFERLGKAADSGAMKLLDRQHTIRYQIQAEEELARDVLAQEFRVYIKEQVTADVLLKYGLDSLVDPAKRKKRRRRYRGAFY
jgi:hypothetical protein